MQVSTRITIFYLVYTFFGEKRSLKGSSGKPNDSQVSGQSDCDMVKNVPKSSPKPKSS